MGRLTPEEIEKLEAYEDAIIAGEIIEPIPNTNLVKIIYRHSDPELAQKIANTLAEVFKNYNLAIATEGSTKAEDLLAKRDCPSPGADQPGPGNTVELREEPQPATDD